LSRVPNMPLKDLVAPTDCSGGPGALVALSQRVERVHKAIDRPTTRATQPPLTHRQRSSLNEADAFASEFLRENPSLTPSTKVRDLLGFSSTSQPSTTVNR